MRVLPCLRSTRDRVLVLGGQGPALEGFVDAHYAGDLDHRYSISGFVLSVFGGAVVWAIKTKRCRHIYGGG